MDSLWNNFFSDPFYFVAAAFAILGAVALLTFIRGFFSGLPHLFTLSEHQEHMDHYRIYAMQGVLALITLFILWEIVRWLFL